MGDGRQYSGWVELGAVAALLQGACYFRESYQDVELAVAKRGKMVPVGQQRAIDVAVVDNVDLVAHASTYTLCRSARYDEHRIGRTNRNHLTAPAQFLFFVPFLGIPYLFVDIIKWDSETLTNIDAAWDPADAAPQKCGSAAPAAGRTLSIDVCWADGSCQHKTGVSDPSGALRWPGWGRFIAGTANYCGAARVSVSDHSPDSNASSTIDLSAAPPAANRLAPPTKAMVPSTAVEISIPPVSTPLDGLDDVAKKCHARTLAGCQAAVASRVQAGCTAACRPTLLPECKTKQQQCESIALSAPDYDLCRSVADKCIASTPIEPTHLEACVNACTVAEQGKACR